MKYFTRCLGWGTILIGFYQLVAEEITFPYALETTTLILLAGSLPTVVAVILEKHFEENN